MKNFDIKPLLDKYYYWEYVPPERCECDCSFDCDLALYGCIDSCATKIGKYSLSNKPLNDDETHIFFQGVVDAFQKHPSNLFFTDNKSLDKKDFYAEMWMGKNLKSDAFLTVDCHFNLPYGEIFWGGDDKKSPVLSIYFATKFDRYNNEFYFKIEKFWKQNSRRNNNIPYNFLSMSALKQQTDFLLKQKINPNREGWDRFIFEEYDIELMGVKQTWLNYIQILGLYETHINNMLIDAISNTYLDCFK